MNTRVAMLMQMLYLALQASPNKHLHLDLDLDLYHAYIPYRSLYTLSPSHSRLHTIYLRF